jgi:Domain of unknown function (DUF4160)
MNMAPIVLYWNELSFPNDLNEGEFRKEGPWAERTKHAFQALECIFHSQQSARVFFAKGQLHATILEKPLLSWLEIWLGRDKLRRIKGRVIQSTNIDEESGQFLACEVKIGSRLGDGVTRAHLAGSWVWSLGNQATASNGPIIPANEHKLNDSAKIDVTEVNISNLACASHFEHWEASIAAWGEQGSESCEISIVNGFRVKMYPFDHGYPHIHVETENPPNSMYKFRIDSFAPLTASPEAVAKLINEWVNQHSESLMQSWKRCKRGLHPLKI